jgi:hypothetical protein
MSFWKRLTSLFKSITAYFRPTNGGVSHVFRPQEQQKSSPPQIEPPRPQEKPQEKPSSSSEASPEYPHGLKGLNRHERRKLEAARRKHDKFVAPQGPEPIKQTRAPPPPSPDYPPAPEPEYDIDVADSPTSGNILVHGPHHNDPKGPDVLFEESEFYGDFNFRDTILDQLDRYFVYLARMKKHEPEDYELYRQIGGTIIPFCSTAIEFLHQDEKDHEPESRKIKPLPSWFKHTRPAFACIAYATDSYSEKYENVPRFREGHGKKLHGVHPRFLYITKYEKAPPEIQRITDTGDIYAMHVWWDDHMLKDQKTGKPVYPKDRVGPTEYAVFVNQSGTKVRVLKVLDTKFLKIPSKRWDGTGRPWRDKFESIPQRAYYLPDFFNTWAKDHHLRPEIYLANIFVETIKMIEQSQYSMLRIEAHKDNLCAVFGVDVARLPYFFQDRDYDLTESGLRKKIFHMVRAHERSDGTVVPFHFRGEKDFTWAGYKIKIRIPGRDFKPIADISIGVRDEFWHEKGVEYVGTKEIGRQLTNMMNKGIGAWKRIEPKDNN